MLEHIKLLPCPFCGSTSIDAEGWASTDRSGPACDGCSGTADTVALWNTRPVFEALRPFGSIQIHPDAPDDGLVVVTNLSGGIIDTGPNCRVSVRDIRRANALIK